MAAGADARRRYSIAAKAIPLVQRRRAGLAYVCVSGQWVCPPGTGTPWAVQVLLAPATRVCLHRQRLSMRDGRRGRTGWRRRPGRRGRTGWRIRGGGRRRRTGLRRALMTLAACDARSDCHSVFEDPGDVRLCHARLLRAFRALRGRRSCALRTPGVAICAIVPPHCEQPARPQLHRDLLRRVRWLDRVHAGAVACCPGSHDVT